MLCLGVVGVSRQVVPLSQRKGIMCKVKERIRSIASQSWRRKMIKDKGKTIKQRLLLMIKQQQ